MNPTSIIVARLRRVFLFHEQLAGRRIPAGKYFWNTCRLRSVVITIFVFLFFPVLFCIILAGNNASILDGYHKRAMEVDALAVI